MSVWRSRHTRKVRCLSEQSFITDYGTLGRNSEILSLANQRLAGRDASPGLKPLHILCNEQQLTRTVADKKNGLSKEEIRRLTNSVRFMEKTGFPLHWAVVGDDALHMESGEARREFSRFQSQLVQAQKRAGFPQHWVQVLEVTGGLHSNVVFIGDERLAKRLCRSFSGYMESGYGHGPGYSMQPAYDPMYLASRYLSKERTPQANYALGWNPQTRERGSHRMEGGGDRVRLSAALKAGGIAAGAIEPWQATNARRSPFVAMKVIITPSLAEKANEPALKPVGQLSLFPELERPITRLTDFTAGILSPSASLELEHRRKRLGLSQSQLGEKAGLSQPQIANAVHCRFGLSRQAAHRIKAALFSMERQAA